jgi:hypothetical protein
MKINIVFTGGLVSAVFLGLLLSPILGADKNDSLKSSYESAKKDIYFLASDDCEGRGPLTKGLDLAADYISQQFKAAGLKPLGKDGSYFQPFSISGAKLDEKPTLVIKSKNVQSDKQIKNRRFNVTNRTLYTHFDLVAHSRQHSRSQRNPNEHALLSFCSKLARE